MLQGRGHGVGRLGGAWYDARRRQCEVSAVGDLAFGLAKVAGADAVWRGSWTVWEPGGLTAVSVRPPTSGCDAAMR